MAKLYRDDISGEEYTTDGRLDEYGLLVEGMTHDRIDVAQSTVRNNPEAVAEELHDMVDAWLDHYQEYLEDGQDYLTECHSCGYRWEYGGTKERATCPECGNKTPANNE